MSSETDSANDVNEMPSELQTPTSCRASSAPTCTISVYIAPRIRCWYKGDIIPGLSSIPTRTLQTKPTRANVTTDRPVSFISISLSYVFLFLRFSRPHRVLVFFLEVFTSSPCSCVFSWGFHVLTVFLCFSWGFHVLTVFFFSWGFHVLTVFFFSWGFHVLTVLQKMIMAWRWQLRIIATWPVLNNVTGWAMAMFKYRNTAAH